LGQRKEKRRCQPTFGEVNIGDYYGEELDFKRVKTIKDSLQPQGGEVIFNIFECGSLRT